MVSIEDFEGKKKDNIPLKIFLWGMAAFVTFMLIIWGWSSVSSGKDFVDKQSKPAVDCLGIVFSLEDIAVDENSVTVTFVNEDFSDHPIQQMVIASGTKLQRRNFSYFEPGMRRKSTFEDFHVINGSIIAFPASCYAYRKEYVSDGNGNFIFKKKVGI